MIHLSVGKQRWIFTSPLQGSVNIHHSLPPLRWIIANYSWIIFGLRVKRNKKKLKCILKWKWKYNYLWPGRATPPQLGAFCMLSRRQLCTLCKIGLSKIWIRLEFTGAKRGKHTFWRDCNAIEWFPMNEFHFDQSQIVLLWNILQHSCFVRGNKLWYIKHKITSAVCKQAKFLQMWLSLQPRTFFSQPSNPSK